LGFLSLIVFWTTFLFNSPCTAARRAV
jgi:hypothetical protein